LPSSTIDDRLAIVVLGHGSREARSNLEFEQLVAQLRLRWYPRQVLGAYVELARPSLADGLREAAAAADRVVVVPCFLFAAGHVKNDLALELFRIRQDAPHVQFTPAQVLGVHPAMVEAALDRLTSASERLKVKRVTIVVGRGSSDPDANGDFSKVVRLISEASSLDLVLPAFVGITKPLFPDVLELAARTRPEEIVVLPYFLFAGRLIDRLSEQIATFSASHPWIRTSLAPHLGLHPGVLRTLDERLNQALNGTAVVPCDNCQYRVPISKVANDVGGLKALLWSVRHLTTHTQSMPHLHAHRPMRKHVLVCGNVDCAARGSIGLISAMRRLIKSAGHEQSVRITRTACMGRCGEGPTVAVYPDGIWYRGVQVEDAAELVEEHFLGDRLVGRLVDGIMQ
jgi:sirohydrochlorin cobaltochelatase